jgi:hypothetical protein
VVAPVLAEVSGRLAIPGVVIEIVLGILIGPEVLGWASTSDIVGTFSNFGLTGILLLAFALLAAGSALAASRPWGQRINGLVRRGRIYRGKLEAIGFGFLVPIFLHRQWHEIESVDLRQTPGHGRHAFRAFPAGGGPELAPASQRG